MATAQAAARILLIDDEPGIRNFVSRGLRGEGFTVDLASDGDAGLKAALGPPYDLIILDLLLPDLGGSVQVLTRPAGVGDFNDATETTSWSVVKLNGRIADSGHWSVGGLVAERETATWRVAGEFVFEPGSGHEVEITTGYGTRALRPLGFGGDQARLDRGVGAVSFQDRWQATDRLATTVGGRDRKSVV